MAAGDFSCSELLAIRLRAEQMWDDHAIQKQYTGDVETARVILTEQTADVTPLESRADRKKRKVEIYWADMCAATVVDCGTDCNPSGEEAESTCKEYEITKCKQTVVSVNEDDFEDNHLSRQEVVARMLLKASKELDEQIARDGVVALNTFKGVDQFTDGIASQDTVTNEDMYIKPAFWTENIFAHLAQAKVLNKFKDSFLLDGGNLFQQAALAQWNASNEGQRNAAIQFGSMQQYYDLFNINAVNGADKVTYMIDKGAIALATRNKYADGERQILNGADRIRFTLPSFNLPGVVYDVDYWTECVSDEIVHTWRLRVRYEYLLNPTACGDTDNTGILGYICGTNPNP